jgi:hypothetical protein
LCLCLSISSLYLLSLPPISVYSPPTSLFPDKKFTAFDPRLAFIEKDILS